MLGEQTPDSCVEGSIERKPTDAQGEHANSTQNGPSLSRKKKSILLFSDHRCPYIYADCTGWECSENPGLSLDSLRYKVPYGNLCGTYSN